MPIGSPPRRTILLACACACVCACACACALASLTASTADAAASASGPTAARTAASNLLTSAPIAAVAEAAALAKDSAPIPATLDPTDPGAIAPYVAAPCVPTFGTGTSYEVCRLGPTGSRHTVVLLGDSHAWMWIPAFVAAAEKLDFTVVPLTKPGCALWALHENRPGWPCRTWYRDALAEIARLKPAATVVSFLTGNYTVGEATDAADELHRVLSAVPHGVILADPPSDDWYADTVATPAACLGTAGANLGTCALAETAGMRASLASIQAMAERDGYPAIPTIQWFCDQGICPTVIGDTVTSEDGNHITPEYASLLAPRLTTRLKPILDRLWSRHAG